MTLNQFTGLCDQYATDDPIYYRSNTTKQFSNLLSLLDSDKRFENCLVIILLLLKLDFPVSHCRIQKDKDRIRKNFAITIQSYKFSSPSCTNAMNQRNNVLSHEDFIHIFVSESSCSDSTNSSTHPDSQPVTFTVRDLISSRHAGYDPNP